MRYFVPYPKQFEHFYFRSKAHSSYLPLDFITTLWSSASQSTIICAVSNNYAVAKVHKGLAGKACYLLSVGIASEFITVIILLLDRKLWKSFTEHVLPRQMILMMGENPFPSVPTNVKKKTPSVPRCLFYSMAVDAPLMFKYNSSFPLVCCLWVNQCFLQAIHQCG